MRSREVRAGIVACVAFSLGAFAQEDVELVSMEQEQLAKGQLVFAADATKSLPKKGFRAEVDGWRLWFLDLDGDGKLLPGDGVAMDGHPFVVELPKVLWLPRGPRTFESKRKSLVLRPFTVDLDEALQRQASGLTDIRISSGLPLLEIDPVTSRDGERHLDYLQRNGVSSRRLTLDVHHEDPELPGYTRSGANAGRIGIVGAGPSLVQDLLNWRASLFHGAILLHPDLARVGVARKHGFSIVVPAGYETRPRNVPDQAPAAFHVHPPPGARRVPLAFCPNEVPNPYPEGSGVTSGGFPVLAFLPPSLKRVPVARFELLRPSGEAVPGFVSSPIEPAHAAIEENYGCAAFLPRVPLDEGTRYVARFQLEGMPRPFEWSFTTWEFEVRVR